MVQTSYFCGISFVFVFLIFILLQFGLEIKSLQVQNILKQSKPKEIRSLQACQSCALFHIGNYPYQGCSWEKKRPNLYCSAEYSGPYAIAKHLWGGLHNVWILLVNGLFLSSAWSSTGGTLVLPAITSSRSNFSKEELAKYSRIPLSEIYDLEHISVYMKETFNLNVCFLEMHDDDPNVQGTPALTMTYMHKVFPNISKTEIISNDILHTKHLDPREVPKAVDLDKNGALNGLGGHWTMESRDTLGEKINSRHLQSWRKAGLAVCFSKKIRELASLSVNWMREKKPFHRLVGLHIRLESDWNQNNWNKDFIQNEFLTHYEKHILKYQMWSSERICLYVSHGNLTYEVSETVNEWLSKFNVSIYRKEDTLHGKNRKRFTNLPLEAKAAVDAETLTYLDHFIGYNISSFSYIVKEKRRYQGKTNVMVAYPERGYDHWLPIFVPKKHAFIRAG